MVSVSVWTSHRHLKLNRPEIETIFSPLVSQFRHPLAQGPALPSTQQPWSETWESAWNLPNLYTYASTSTNPTSFTSYFVWCTCLLLPTSTIILHLSFSSGYITGLPVSMQLSLTSIHSPLLRVSFLKYLSVTSLEFSFIHSVFIEYLL